MRMRISDVHVDQFKHAEGLNTLCSLLLYMFVVYLNTVLHVILLLIFVDDARKIVDKSPRIVMLPSCHLQCLGIVL